MRARAWRVLLILVALSAACASIGGMGHHGFRIHGASGSWATP